MTKQQSKFTVASLIIVGAIFYLIFTGVSQTSVYYLTVSELMDRKETISFDDGVRVSGTVVPGSIERHDSHFKVNFKMTDSKKDILVHYEGIIPDMFKDNVDIVVEGTMDRGDNILTANTLLTSCPSKYEAEKSESSIM